MEASTETKPPSGGFRTWWNFVDQLHEHRPIPHVLDRSVMAQRGGTARSELYMALRFFAMIDGEKRPLPILHETIDGEGPTPAKLRVLIERHYAPVIALGLDRATPRQVDEALIAMGSTPAAAARARTFFLNAAEEAGIEVGRVLKTARAPTTTRRRTKPKPKPSADNLGIVTGAQAPAKALPPVIGALVDKLPTENDGWDESEARQWLSLVAPAIAYDYKLDLSKLTEGGS